MKSKNRKPQEIPSAFTARYRTLFGNESETATFLEYCHRPLRRAIRVNRLKTTTDECISRLKAQNFHITPVPWNEYGFWAEKTEELALGNTVEHFMGYFYIQEASSMIPPLILDPKPGETVLDACAAPGSKTTQMAEMMGNTGLIISNDTNISRIKALRYNLDKAGIINTIVTRMDGAKLTNAGIEFDRILLDAPCSAEGTIRKDYKVINTWSEKHIFTLSRLQKHLIINAYNSLRPGGTMVYSTCTLAPEENEEVVSYLLDKKPDMRLEKINLSGLKSRPGITEWNKKEYNTEVQKTARIYPQDNDSEGFFVAKLKKE